jgi:hypothetical protein
MPPSAITGEVIEKVPDGSSSADAQAPAEPANSTPHKFQTLFQFMMRSYFLHLSMRQTSRLPRSQGNTVSKKRCLRETYATVHRCFSLVTAEAGVIGRSLKN